MADASPLLQSIVRTFDLSKMAHATKIHRVLHVHSERSTPFAARPCSTSEVHYVASGEIAVQIDGQQSMLQEGELLLCHPGQSFGMPRFQVRGRLSVFHSHFSFGLPTAILRGQELAEWASVVSSIDAAASGHDRALHLPDRISIADRTSAATTFLAILDHQNGAKPGFALASDALFLLFLQRVSCQVISDLDAGHVEHPANSLHITRALSYITSAIDHQISLSDVAQHVGVSRHHLSRVFKDQLGCTVGEYILRKKIELAKERLLAARTTVRRVALSLGYDDALYFSRLFRRSTGLSPQAYMSHHGVIVGPIDHRNSSASHQPAPSRS
ncbi:MAG: helix-turn-helix transcriptional regulator [Planctomycetes bacterium]|nr:helix-turn-helix transcriptional regulator [Planctomycetota bacterium]